MATKRVLGINGSPRKDGNTAILIRKVFAELEAEGIETELVQLSGHPVRGCLGCGKCYERKDGRCVIETDILNDLIPRMRACDGLVLGSPTYFTDVTSNLPSDSAELARYVGGMYSGNSTTPLSRAYPRTTKGSNQVATIITGAPANYVAMGDNFEITVQAGKYSVMATANTPFFETFISDVDYQTPAAVVIGKVSSVARTERAQ